MVAEPELSVVIVNYNTKEYTAQCIESLYQAPPEVAFEIVLVDNASTDDSVPWLEQRFPQVKLVRSARNGGIAGGNNLGIRNSAGSLILLLNNDTLVLPGSIDRCIEFLRAHPEAAGVGGELLNPDHTFQSGYSGFPTLWEQFLVVTRIGMLFRPYFPSRPPGRLPCPVDWMSTAFMLFRCQPLEQVDLVDEDFFIYCDETDLQYRLRQAGWQLYYLPEVKTIHFGGKSLNPWRRRKMVYRGYLLFFRKHYPRWKETLLRLLYLLVSCLKVPYWAGNLLLPSRRPLARHELQSNLEIIRISFSFNFMPPP